MSKKLFLQQDKKIRNSANLSSQTITTTDFFVNLPIFSRVVIPDDKFTVKHSQLNNVNSLPVPSFVDVTCRNRWFYSKFADIWLPFEAWLTGGFFQTLNGQNVSPAAPLVSNTVICQVLFTYYLDVKESIAYSVPDLASSMTDGQKPDLVVVTSETGGRTINQVRLNNEGKRLQTILRLLGYNLPYIIDISYYIADIQKDTQQVYNLFPIMSYYNVMLWNYVPEKWRNDYIPAYGYLRQQVAWTNWSKTYPTGAHAWSAFVSNLDGTVGTIMNKIFDTIVMSWLGDDYFTSSLITPMESSPSSPIRDVTDITLAPQPAQSRSKISSQGSNGAVVSDVPQLNGAASGTSITPASQTPYNVTAYMQNLLKSLTLRVQQRALSPNSVIGRMFSMFGVKSDQKSWLPTYLDGKSYKIVIRPEISNADTESTGGKSLGYRGGTAQGYDTDEKSKHFEFEHYGMLFCINSITPHILYVDGVDRECLWTSPDEFARPEMQNAGFQAIATAELTNKVLGFDTTGSGTKRTTVFGYTPVSAELMHPHDRVAGLFKDIHLNAFMDAFFINKRVVSYNEGDPSATPAIPPHFDFIYPVVNNKQFAQARPVDPGSGMELDQGYDRIFNAQSAFEDHIEQWNYFEVYATRNVQDPGNFTIGDKQGRVDEIAGLMNTVANG